MPIKLTLNIDGVNDMIAGPYGTAAKAVVERGTAVAGPFTAAGTALLVANQAQYEVWDTTGTSDYYYRYRVTDATAVIASAYSDVFRSTSMESYATLDDLLERIQAPDETRYNLIGDLLAAVSDQFDTEAGRQFYRIPQVSGEATRLYDGPVGNELRLPEGCVSLSLVEVASGTGQTYASLPASAWRLRPSYPEPGWPYTRLVLTELATTGFASGFDTIRLTGVFGWSTVPLLVSEAVLQVAQGSYNRSMTADAGQIGLAELGSMTLSIPRPDAWYRALRAYGRRAGAAV
jgi:hypothetical protein